MPPIDTKIFWIDENPEKLPSRSIRDNIMEACDADLIPIEADQTTLAKLSKDLAEPGTNKMVVLDYLLNNLQPSDDNGERETQFGSDWASSIRSEHPNVSLVGVTDEVIENIPETARRQVITFFRRGDFWDGNNLGDLKAILNDYPKLFELHSRFAAGAETRLGFSRHAKVPRATLLDLFGVPESVRGALELALPEFAKRPWDTGTAHQLAGWIWHVLLGRPGFLYDELEAATALGLSPEGFSVHTEAFESALYRGAFASNDRKRWWVCLLPRSLEALIQEKVSGALQKYRSRLFETDEGRFSHAHGHPPDETCIPDCVAFRDEGRNPEQRVQALERDTRLDDSEEPPFGFETRRIFSSAE